MTRSFCLVLLCLAACTAWLSSAPLAGHKGLKVKMQPAEQRDGQIVPAQVELTEKFKGGRRACVILVGDHEPVARLSVHVYDQDQLVAQDEGDDYAAAIWYPPRDGEFKIVIKNHHTEYGEFKYTDVRVILK